VEGPVRGRPGVHHYFPEIGKTKRVTSSAQLEGFLGQADLGIEEMAQLLDPLSGEKVRLIDSPGEIGGRSVWVVETLPEDDDARYSRIVTFVDREYCVPLRTEFYDQEGQARKLLRVDPTRVIREAQSWLPRHMVFRDLESGSESVLEIEEVEIDVPLAPSLLTVKALPGGARNLQSR
jgi:outer membrane lipoprotein-sorting protein